MKPGLKTAGALALTALLGACGGGGGAESKNDTPPPMTQGELRTFSSSAYTTGLFLPYFALGYVNALITHVGDGMPEGPQPCAEGKGSRTSVYTDADHDGKISAGDSLAIDMTDCATRGLGEALNGQVRILVREVQGDLVDGFNTSGVFTLEAPDLALSANESIAGTLQVRFEQTTHDIPEDSATPDDIEEILNISQSGGDFKVRYTEDGKTYGNAISDYAAESHYLYATGTERYTALQFSSRGQSVNVGDFEQRTKLIDPLVFVHAEDGGAPGPISGRFTVETRGETITTTFSSPAAGASNVLIESSSGVRWSGSSDDGEL
ncbi:hypothetical protein N5K27_17575 [Pigmentiphaga sp. GD03639]|uniref:Lipoprotein n=1 Tax=Pigmentiphaga daeguensis TaxID=414049 RepID=A0ABN1CKS9_9BURK|nr:hypothetical protein [Pigmentiphaga sp. GD03639]MDH2238108.1 hypothetical protein [Pigmentiphaga sp. GD03639]